MNKCQWNKTLNYTQNGITTNFVVAAMVQQLFMKAFLYVFMVEAPENGKESPHSVHANGLIDWFLYVSKFTQTHVTRNNKQN